MTVRVPAKVNLQLSIGPPRHDGYHDLATVFQAVSLYDDVTAAPADGLQVTITGDHATGVPDDDTNLAVRAARLVAERMGRAADVHLTLAKGIPVAGGLAGGSGDGAAALVACDALWGAGLGRSGLLRLATHLGSDVPFALVGGTAIGMGRGERLTPALARGQFRWVLATVADGLSTASVYAECDRLRAHRPVPAPRISDTLMSALRAGDPHALGSALHNDLQAAACRLRPQLSRTLAVGEDCGALGWLVSGSGPTCAFLAGDAEHAEELTAAIEASGTCDRVQRVSGPVPGARVIDGADR